jgi:hypothetical protein
MQEQQSLLSGQPTQQLAYDPQVAAQQQAYQQQLFQQQQAQMLAQQQQYAAPIQAPPATLAMPAARTSPTSTILTQNPQAMTLNTTAQPNIPETSFAEAKPKFKINYRQFDVNRVTCLPLERKTIPKKEGQYYHIIPLRYNTGTTDNPSYEDLAIEGPLLDSDYGISERIDEETKRASHSVGVKLSPSNPEEAAFLKVLELLHKRCLQIMHHFRVSPLLHKDWRQFNPISPGKSFKNPIYTTAGEDGEAVKGASANVYFKCFKSGQGDRESKSLFTDLRKKPIDWSFLTSAEIKLQPVVHAEKIYIGNTASTQIKLRSAFVTKVVARNSETSQGDSIDDYLKRNPNAVDQLDMQLAKIAVERQAKVAKERGELPGMPTSNQPVGSTFDGIGSGGFPSMAPLGNDLPSTSEFLGGAPMSQFN